MSEVFETEVRLALGRIEEKMNEFSEQLKRHDKLLHGKNGSVGIEMRLDRIEQSEEGRKWHVRTIWVALMALMAWVAKSLLGFIVLVGFVGCSTYTIERRVPIFDKDGQFLGESYVLLRETVPFGGKKIGSESLYLQDGEKIIEFGRRQNIDNEGTGRVLEKIFDLLFRAAMASQGAAPISVLPPEPARPRDPGVVEP